MVESFSRSDRGTVAGDYGWAQSPTTTKAGNKAVVNNRKDEADTADTAKIVSVEAHGEESRG